MKRQLKFNDFMRGASVTHYGEASTAGRGTTQMRTQSYTLHGAMRKILIALVFCSVASAGSACNTR